MNAANCFTFIATSHAPVSYLAYACRSSEREQPRIDVPELLRIVESPEEAVNQSRGATRGLGG
jgi:hypothetical protein